MVKIGQLSSEITKVLKEYTSEVEEDLEKAKKKVADDGVKKLKSSGPSKTGAYRRGWRVKRERKGLIIHNATHGSLTHLLENGHAKRNGGRVAGIPHIAPVEQKMITDFEKEVERAIKK